MQENSRYAVGIDIGTTMVRCVVGHLDPVTGAPTIIGVGQHKNSGMRKGSVVNLTGPAQAIDDAPDSEVRGHPHHGVHPPITRKSEDGCDQNLDANHFPERVSHS